jgi:hypothetical protein
VHNNFTFEGNSLDDLWKIDASISFKNETLVEIIRSVVLWIVWLERNRICFNIDVVPKSIKMLGMQILRLIQFLCKNLDEALLLIIQYILPQDVQSLHLQVGNSRTA